MINVGIIGYGYWGRNIARNFSKNKNIKVVAVCDTDYNALQCAHDEYPHVKLFSNYQDVLSSLDIDTVAIVSPSSTHFELSKQALRMKKHVFVEKPFVSTPAEAEELIELAEKNRLLIMVDYTFLFSSSVRKIKQLIGDDALGELYYFDSIRVNLGPFRHDSNVIRDLASHDFSIMDYLIDEKPIAISSNGTSVFGNGLEDVGYVTVYFTSNFIAHFNVNWIYPFKIRTTFITGEKKMIVWNDLNSDEKIKVYNKDAIVEYKEGAHKYLMGYNSGDIWSPKIEQKEELRTEVEHFVDCILNSNTPINSAYTGLRIVKMLEAANKSLKNHGKMIYL